MHRPQVRAVGAAVVCLACRGGGCGGCTANRMLAQQIVKELRACTGCV